MRSRGREDEAICAHEKEKEGIMMVFKVGHGLAAEKRLCSFKCAFHAHFTLSC